MKIKVYPKVNLCLKIYKNKNESKHNLDSIFYLSNKVHDTIKIIASDKPEVIYKQHGRKIDIAEDIITKTLRYLNIKYKWDVNYKFIVTKRIPFGAGLGGGSADAGAVINFLHNKYRNTILDLLDIASKLGSDIPFFITGYKIARVRGIGEIVSPIYDWQPKIKLHFNGCYSSTVTIFKALDSDPTYQSRVDVDKIIRSHLYKQDLNLVYNDLTKYIIQNNKKLQEEYRKYDSHSFFTGAGSTIVTLKGK